MPWLDFVPRPSWPRPRPGLDWMETMSWGIGPTVGLLLVFLIVLALVLTAKERMEQADDGSE